MFNVSGLQLGHNVSTSSSESGVLVHTYHVLISHIGNFNRLNYINLLTITSNWQHHLHVTEKKRLENKQLLIKVFQILWEANWLDWQPTVIITGIHLISKCKCECHRPRGMPTYLGSICSEGKMKKFAIINHIRH